MTTLDKVLYTARAHTTGGRDGASRTDDGRLDVKLSSPGTSGTGTNPEQLFAAGYSACFIGALKAVGGMQKIAIPQDVAVDAEVDLGPITGGYGIAVRLQVHLPGMERAAAQALVDAAHKVCPYSNATRGNIDVTLTLALEAESLSSMPALLAKTHRPVVAKPCHSPSYGCVLRLDPARFDAPFWHGRKTLSL